MSTSGAMRVLLLDIDSRIPNLALMKLAAWHKSQGDEVALQKMSRPDLVYVSCVFTWGRSLAERAVGLYPNAACRLGGSGFDLTVKLPDDVEATRPDYGLYSWAVLEAHGFKKPFGQGYLIKVHRPQAARRQAAEDGPRDHVDTHVQTRGPRVQEGTSHVLQDAGRHV